MNSDLILGGIIGLLIGLAWCYWRQIQLAYENRDAISATGRLFDDISAIKEGLKL